LVDGYCSTVQGLLDWFEVDLGFTELSFIQIDLCSLCVFVLYSRVSLSSCSFTRHYVYEYIGGYQPVQDAITVFRLRYVCMYACMTMCDYINFYTCDYSGMDQLERMK